MVVLDWDGTVVDSIRAIVDCSLEAFADTAGRVGYAPPSRESVRHAIGSGLAATVLALVPDLPLDWVGRVAERYRELWIGRYQHEVQPFEKIEQVLAALRDRGFLLAIATAKRRSGLERELERFGLRGYFAGSRTVDEAPPKPHPGMLLGLLEEFRLRPQELLMVGDSSFDLEMARSAGCPRVGVLSGAQPRALLEPLDPLAILESVHSLPDWLLAAGTPGAASPAPAVARS